MDIFTQSFATSDGFMGYYSYGVRSFIEKLNVVAAFTSVQTQPADLSLAAPTKT